MEEKIVVNNIEFVKTDDVLFEYNPNYEKDIEKYKFYRYDSKKKKKIIKIKNLIKSIYITNYGNIIVKNNMIYICKVKVFE